MNTYIIIIAVFVILMAFMLRKIYISCNKEIKPGEVLVVVDGSGRKFHRTGKVFVVPLIQHDSTISLAPFDISCRLVNLQNREGSMFEAEVGIRLRMGESDKELEIAADRFANKAPEQMKEFIEGIVRRNFTIYLQELELKALIEGSSALYKKVEDSIVEDLKNMGLIVDSFEIKSFKDTQGLLQKLKAQ